MSDTAGSPKNLIISLDTTGHLKNVPCTWAPSNTPVGETYTGQSPLYGGAYASPINSISSIDDGKSKEHSPLTERFPPLYMLPRRTTHNYECECKIHDGNESCHCEPSPMTMASRRHTMNEHVDGSSSKPMLSMGSRSWTMEDQRRLQHAKMIYNDEKRPYSWEEL